MTSKNQSENLYRALFDALALGSPLSGLLMSDLARNAGEDVAAVASFASSPLALIGQFSRSIDLLMLADFDEAMMREPSRERLFDTLMNRLDHLQAHKAGLSALFKQAKRDPALAIGLNGIALRSMAIVLDSSGISASGLIGAARAQALAVGFGQVLNVWFEDDALDSPKTMAELDRVLKRGENLFSTLDRFSPMQPHNKTTAPKDITPKNPEESSDHEREHSAN